MKWCKRLLAEVPLGTQNLAGLYTNLAVKYRRDQRHSSTALRPLENPDVENAGHPVSGRERHDLVACRLLADLGRCLR